MIRPMPLLVAMIDHCRRNALAVVITAIFLGIFAVTYAAGHLGLSSETDLLFSSDLPWRQRRVFGVAVLMVELVVHCGGHLAAPPPC